MHRRRREEGKAHLFPAQREDEAHRDGGLLLHRLQITEGPRSHPMPRS
jgi:hypothetical protein